MYTTAECGTFSSDNKYLVTERKSKRFKTLAVVMMSNFHAQHWFLGSELEGLASVVSSEWIILLGMPFISLERLLNSSLAFGLLHSAILD